MTGSEKIINKILSDSKSECDAVMVQAQKQADDIAEKAKQDAVLAAHKVLSDAEQEAKRQEAAAASSAELVKRNMLLKARREIISDTIDALAEHLVNLSDSAYFELLYSCAGSLKCSTGTIYLNSKDLARLPADFLDRMKAAGIDAELSKESVDIIGGFILRCGDIDFSADFNAMINEKRDVLEDFINSRLFSE